MSKHLKIPTETEVDFVNLAKTVWKRRMLVAKLTGIAAVTGLLISIMIPVQYTASTTLVQEIADPKITLNEAKLSAISALAAVAGVDLSGLTKAKMSPKTYAMIISSIPFRQDLLKTRLNFGQADTAITLYDYYTKKGRSSQNKPAGTRSLPQQTREEIRINKILDKQIALQLQDDEYITFSCTLPDAYAAAQLTRSAGELLQKYLTGIQTEKARANLQFIQERHDEAKSNFLKIQEELTALHAGKESLSLSAAYRLAENSYLDLAKKLEQAKIALNEQTPVFKVIDPVTVPTGRSYPDRTKITAIFSFFGFVLALVLILGRGFFEETKERWNR